MTLQKLKELSAARGFPRVSIYIPTHEKGAAIQQDPIRLKNALAAAGEQLQAGGLATREVEEILEAARARIENDTFWQHQEEGLAVFIDRDRTRFRRLPFEVEEFVEVGDRFHIRPVIAHYAREGRFALVAITRDRVRFFDGDLRTLSERSVDDLPEDIMAIRGKTDFDAYVGYHPTGSGSDGGSVDTPHYHSLGESASDYDEVEFEKFVQQIAKAVAAELSGTQIPLVVAGDPRTVGWFRKACQYDGLVEGDIQKNPEAIDRGELHAAALELVQPLLDADRRAALERLEARLAGGDEPATSEITSLVRAAANGRVDTLFLARNEIVIGRFDQDKQEVEFAQEPGPDSEDLLDLIAANTLMNGGEVFLLPKDKEDSVGPAAAILRF